MSKENKNIETLKVASTSNPNSVAGSIVKNIQEGKTVYLTAIGAGAVNQMVKAYGIARGFAAPSGIELHLAGGFADTMIKDEDGNEKKKTMMKFKVIVIQ